ncbi:FixH family protein [Paraglaciecola aquimarina]|uniref:FixH family protein n=1 Tax=Paraglaciecola aquimarina TaxID=1235557 RepID=A0ABU3SYU8_9ALTE|nr:FixH family protein [Paraglaciecola aquimarina]MDU0355092.1 FixH family protein [Paraglaciecola aquimarina]
MVKRLYWTFITQPQDFKDFSVNLFKDANGIYRAPLAIDISGKWKVTLRPFTTSWKIQHDISLPREGSFEFKP